MTPDQVFSITNVVAFVAWVMLAALPKQRWVAGAVTGVIVPLLLAVVYVAIVSTTFASTPGGFSTLPDVMTLFSHPWALLAGWIHYLAFDLLVGTWEVRDAREQGIPHLLVVPCLALTFIFGPAGWLLYRIVRAGHQRMRSTAMPSHAGA